MNFIENKGQWNNSVDFKGDFNSGSFFIENDGFTVLTHNETDLKNLNALTHGNSVNEMNNPFILHSNAYKVKFIGAYNFAEKVPEKIQNSYNNYFIGNNPSKWASNCKIYQSLTYKDIYQNIDIHYYSDGNRIKYDFIVHPGGNPNKIILQYDGVQNLKLKNQELFINTSVGTIKELNPYTYQIQNEKQLQINCKYILQGNVIQFYISNYNKNETLVIDPSIIFSTFTGSTADNWGYTATPGTDGSFFAGGIAFGVGFPSSTGAFQTTFGGGTNENSFSPYDVAIIKLSPNGSQRVYATYLGGSGNEQPHSMICDAQGNLIVVGRTSSGATFPGSQIGSGGGYDIFLTKFNSSGTAIIGSTKIGGSLDDGVNVRAKYAPETPAGTAPFIAGYATRRNYGDDARSEVILDATGNIYMASCTQSSNFPVSASPIQSNLQGTQDGVILKFNANLSSNIFSTYFGSSDYDACFALSFNPINGNLYVAGATCGGILPGDKTGVISSAYNGGEVDGFVTEIKPDGTTILKTCYFGTGGNDLVYGIQFDKKGFPYIMGTTTGNWQISLPLGGNTFGSGGISGKQFICKLQPDLSAYIYSTVFGTASSTPNISPVAFLVDRCENVYVSGWGGGLNIGKKYPNSGTNGLPIVNPLRYANGNLVTQPDGEDLYFFVMEKNAQSQLFGSPFGQNGGLGDHVDGGTSRFDANGIIYQALCANCGRDVPFPTTPGVWASTNGSNECNEAAVKIEMNFAGIGASVKASIDGVIDSIGCVPLTIMFTDTLAKGKKYIWHYGDPYDPTIDITYAPNNSTTHTYTHVGWFKLMLVSIDSSTCNIADTAYITVKVGNNEIKPLFNPIKLPPCTNLTYQFNNTSTAPNAIYNDSTFIWDFGDGSPLIKANYTSVSHTYASAGTYKVRLLTKDTTFCNSPVYFDSTIRLSVNVKAAFTTPSKGCVPYLANFVNTSLGGTSFEWQEQGVGTFSTLSTPLPVSFPSAGIHNIRLIANDPNTCNLTDTSSYFTITIYDNALANFSWLPNPPIVNRITSFTNLSSGAISYLWNFGDGETSTEINPQHQFNATNTYYTTLYAFNAVGCVDSTTKNISIIIEPLLDVPNAFTPGKFGINGMVKVLGFGIGKMNWKIYNRWGQVVFATNNRKQGWDGTFKGQIQPIDVYTYTLDVEFTDGKKVRKTGDITLLK